MEHLPWHTIKLVVSDVDGTLTDAGVYIDEDGKQSKKFNARDGMGFTLLMKAGFKTGMISASINHEIVLTRARMLKLDYCYVGEDDKWTVLQGWCRESGILPGEVLYIGDDLNDLSIMQQVGIAVCPADSANKIKEISHLVLTRNGGDAAFRELADILLASKEKSSLK